VRMRRYRLGMIHTERAGNVCAANAKDHLSELQTGNCTHGSGVIMKVGATVASSAAGEA
jgi:hypothetical protein